MKKNIVALVLCFTAIATLGTIPTCASNFGNTTNRGESRATSERKNEASGNKNIIIGKIQSINNSNVVIEIANRNKNIERPEKANTSKNFENNQKRENFKPENMYKFTGETKTIDISSADLGRAKKDNNSEDEKGKKLTISDYNVGDIVRITVESENTTKATRMREAGFGSNREKIGNYKGKYKENKKANQQ